VLEHTLSKNRPVHSAGRFFIGVAPFAAILLILIKTLLARCVSAQIANRLYNTVKAFFGESHECSI
jgi:hypothetical protein